MANSKMEELCSSAVDYQRRKNETVDPSKLPQIHDDFSAPGCVVRLGGKTLDNTQVSLTRLEVNLNGDGTASGCSFSACSVYDQKKEVWVNAVADSIEVGAKLTVAVGYVTKYEVFYGYVDDFTVVYPEAETGQGQAPSIEVTGIDALGYLMSNNESIYNGKEKVVSLIKNILSRAQSAGYAKDVYVSSLEEFVVPERKEKGDDWSFLNTMAQQYNASLRVLDGVLIFDDDMDNDSILMTLELGRNLKSLRKRVSLAHQVGEVEIHGRNDKQEPVKAAVTSVTIGGKGRTAAEIAPAFAKSKRKEENEFVRTEEECRRMAQNRMNSIAMGFVSGEGECIGMPALVPGRYIRIKGSDPLVNGDYYLTRVRHSLSGGGFFTSFEFKGAKL